MTLSEFLDARLDEDEAAALAAGGERWRLLERSSGWGRRFIGLAQTGDIDVGETYGERPSGYAEHIARHDPARVLAEVAVKRQLIEEIEDENALRFLALPYADHPDYRPEWAP